MNNFAVYSALNRIADAEGAIRNNFNLSLSTDIGTDELNPDIVELGVYLYDGLKQVYSKSYNFSDFIKKPDTTPLNELIQFITKYREEESKNLLLSQTEQEGWGWDNEDMSDIRKVVCFHKKENGQYLCWHDSFDIHEAKRTTRTFVVQNFSVEKPIL